MFNENCFNSVKRREKLDDRVERVSLIREKRREEEHNENEYRSDSKGRNFIIFMRYFIFHFFRSFLIQHQPSDREKRINQQLFFVQKDSIHHREFE